MMLERFNKSNVATFLYRRWKELGIRHDFTENNGYAQVEGHPIATVVAYGEFKELGFLLRALGLIDSVPEEEMKHTPFGLHNGNPRSIKD